MRFCDFGLFAFSQGRARELILAYHRPAYPKKYHVSSKASWLLLTGFGTVIGFCVRAGGISPPHPRLPEPARLRHVHPKSEDNGSCPGAV
jgi:hypothetical protein